MFHGIELNLWIKYLFNVVQLITNIFQWYLVLSQTVVLVCVADNIFHFKLFHL